VYPNVSKAVPIASITHIIARKEHRDRVRNAYGEKYPTKASRKWVEGFGEPARELPALRLADLIEAPAPPPRAVALVLRSGGALVVDRVRPPVSLVVEPLGRLLALHPWLAGAAVDPRGRALGVLDTDRLLHAFATRTDDAEPTEARRVLVVDDSLVAREAAAAQR
jgi:chemotaxis protein histidine kinase CheA